MSPGKLAAQASHGSMAFLTQMIRENAKKIDSVYLAVLELEPDLFEQWIQGAFTKTILEAKNRNQLLKAKTMAEEMGLKEGQDFFLIRDNCYTELEPEEVDENGVGRTLTCIGFRPMVLSGELNDALSGRLFYADFRFPQGYQSL